MEDVRKAEAAVEVPGAYSARSEAILGYDVVGVSRLARHRGRLASQTDIIGDLLFPYRFRPVTTASLGAVAGW